MSSKVFMYIGASVLFLIGLCLVGYGALALIGSTSPIGGQENWVPLGIGLGVFGLLLLAGGGGLLWLAIRGQKTEVVQEVKIDLPGETKLEEMKCRSCGGTLTADNIKLVNGAPTVNCPYCHTVYQLTEEPKW